MRINKSDFSVFRSPFLRGTLRVALLVAIGLMGLAGTATLPAGVVGITVDLNTGSIVDVVPETPVNNFVALPADLKVVGPIYWTDSRGEIARLEEELATAAKTAAQTATQSNETEVALEKTRVEREVALEEARGREKKLFIYHHREWEVITNPPSGPSIGDPRAVIQIDLSDGSILRVHRPKGNPFGTKGNFRGLPQTGAPKPNNKSDLQVVGPIYWAASSPGCLYINHGGNFYVICD